MAIEREAFIYGIYPRTPDFIKATRDVDRNRNTRLTLENYRNSDRQKLLDLQKDEGLIYFEDGKLDWQDLFRPIVESTEGISTGPLTRFFDNNTFYRQPVINGDLHPDFGRLDKYFPGINPREKWKVTLPSPLTFAALAEDSTGNSNEKTLENISGLTSKIIAHLEDRGVNLIQLNEPYLPYTGSSEKDLDNLIAAISYLDPARRRAVLGINFYFGDGAPAARKLARKDGIVDFVGLDFTRTNLSDLPEETEYDLMAGVIDGRNSLLEDEANIRRFLEKAEAKFPGKRIYISHSSDLELLPEQIAVEKVKLLGRLAKK